jgi:hypothetical protein
MKYLRDMISMTYTPEEYFSDESPPLGPTSAPVAPDGKKRRLITEPTAAEKELLQNLSWKLQIVLTKCDLVERSVLARRVQEIREDVIKSFPFLGKGGHTSLPVMMISGLYGNGIVELQKELVPLVPPKDPTNSSSFSLDQTGEGKSHSALIDDLGRAFTHLSSADLLSPPTQRSSETKVTATGGRRRSSSSSKSSN